MVDLVDDLQWRKQDEGYEEWLAWRSREGADGDVGVVRHIGMG